MSTAAEAPSLIQYACERCKTRFVLPPSRRRLGFGGRFKATGMALSRTLRFHEGLGSTYDGARRQLLAKMDDDAYQSFVQSFKFCHECRQFVCSECWSNSRKTCLGCFAKAAGTTVRQRPPFAPEGPPIPRPVAAAVPIARRRRLRTDASLLVMGAAVLLLVVEMVVILPGINNHGASATTDPNVAAGSPSDSPSADPTISPTDTPTAASPTASPTATPTASPSPTPTATPTPTPTPTPRPATPRPATPKPTAPWPTVAHITCAGGPGTITCTWTNPDPRTSSVSWLMSVESTTKSGNPVTFNPEDTGIRNVTLTVLLKNGRKLITNSGPVSSS